MTLSVAVMQPYFFPYGGYFRLFREADIFVFYDCVQFPRRGYVHRNRFRDYNGRSSWLTLPLKKSPRDTLIRDLEFSEDPLKTFIGRAEKFPDLKKFISSEPDSAVLIPLRESLLDFDRPVTDYLVDTLVKMAERLGHSARMLRSSSLDIAPALRGQDRILEVINRVGGTHYINSPGGRALYDADAFQRHQITLEFLPEYQGGTESSLQILLSSGVTALQNIDSGI